MSTRDTYIGETVKFEAPNIYEKIRYNLEYQIGLREKSTICEEMKDQYSWTLPQKMGETFPYENEQWCEITYHTLYDGDEIDSGQLRLMVRISPEVKPSVDLKISESISEVAKNIGAYVKGLSRLSLKAGGAGAQGSYVQSYVISFEGVNYRAGEVTTDYLTTAGEKTVTATVTDTRGRTNTISKKIMVLDYEKPHVSNFSVEHSETNAEIDLECGVTPLAGNTATYLLEYRKKVDETFKTIPAALSGQSVDKKIKISGIDSESLYVFKITVSDLFYSTVVTYELDTDFTLIDYNVSGKGFAIGKVSEISDAIEIALPISFAGNSYAWNEVNVFAGPNVLKPSESFAYPVKYRKIGSHIFVDGYISVRDYKGETELFTLPSGYRKKGKIYVRCPTAENYIALIGIDEGKAVAEWIKALNGTDKTGAVSWIYLHLDFFTD